MRDFGFYWVKLSYEWLVAEFTPKGWLVPGSEEYFVDTDFTEFGPKVERVQ